MFLPHESSAGEVAIASSHFSVPLGCLLPTALLMTIRPKDLKLITFDRFGPMTIINAAIEKAKITTDNKIFGLGGI